MTQSAKVVSLVFLYGPSKGCGGGSQCSANAKCIDDASSEDKDHLYKCVCKQGFQGDGKVCQRGEFLVINIECIVFYASGIPTAK